MSANYDMIATVDIDISPRIVDNASFDKILIVGPLPNVAPATAPAQVGVYDDIDKVVDAGWSITEGSADPIGIAAQIAFGQTPEPSDIYIAPVQIIEGESEKAVNAVKRASATSGWYVVCPVGIDETEYDEIAAYVETQEKLCFYTELGVFNKGEDEAEEPTVTGNYLRTFGIYGRENTNQAEEDIPEANKYINVAAAVKWLSYESGTETAAYKALSGIRPSVLTTDEMKTLEKLKLNYFITVGGKNITMGGTVLGDEWADIIRFRDWLKNDMQVRVVNAVIENAKIPFSDAGIAMYENQMLASLKAGQSKGGIAQEEYDNDGNVIPAYKTIVPLASSLTATEKSTRRINGLKFKARLAGAIHVADISGTLSHGI